MRAVEVLASSAVATVVPGTVAVIVGQTVGVDAWSGWSAFGLAGLILAWLFFRHLPDKDKQLKEKDDVHRQLIKELNDAHIEQVREIVAANAAIEKERRQDFKAALDTVVEHCEREGLRINETLKAQGVEATAAVVDLRRTLEELRSEHFFRAGDEPPRKLTGPREQQS